MPVKTTKRKAVRSLVQHPVAYLTHARKVGKASTITSWEAQGSSRWWHICKFSVCSRTTTAAVFPQCHSWWKSGAVTSEGWELLSRFCCTWHWHAAG